jgi:DNA-directed RNA polymerase specialized sigma24 family protein
MCQTALLMMLPPTMANSSTRCANSRPGQRAAVYLHYQADLPVREIAGLMGTSAATVKVQLSRGRRRLAQILGTGEVIDA